LPNELHLPMNHHETSPERVLQITVSKQRTRLRSMCVCVWWIKWLSCKLPSLANNQLNSKENETTQETYRLWRSWCTLDESYPDEIENHNNRKCTSIPSLKINNIQTQSHTQSHNTHTHTHTLSLFLCHWQVTQSVVVVVIVNLPPIANGCLTRVPPSEME
jgi:hypothetical protein